MNMQIQDGEGKITTEQVLAPVTLGKVSIMRYGQINNVKLDTGTNLNKYHLKKFTIS
jgi:hypothetical protein